MTKEKNSNVWKAMEVLEKEGKVRAIGVSNFQIHHLNDLIETAEIIPMMNQIEIHPHLIQYNVYPYQQDLYAPSFFH